MLNAFLLCFHAFQMISQSHRCLKHVKFQFDPNTGSLSNIPSKWGRNCKKKEKKIKSLINCTFSIFGHSNIFHKIWPSSKIIANICKNLWNIQVLVCNESISVQLQFRRKPKSIRGFDINLTIELNNNSTNAIGVSIYSNLIEVFQLNLNIALIANFCKCFEKFSISLIIWLDHWNFKSNLSQNQRL